MTQRGGVLMHKLPLAGAARPSSHSNRACLQLCGCYVISKMIDGDLPSPFASGSLPGDEEALRQPSTSHSGSLGAQAAGRGPWTPEAEASDSDVSLLNFLGFLTCPLVHCKWHAAQPAAPAPHCRSAPRCRWHRSWQCRSAAKTAANPCTAPPPACLAVQEESTAVWRELSAELPGDPLAAAAAGAAAAAAHGQAMPPCIAASVRHWVPGLLSLDVRLPASEQQQHPEAQAPSGGSSATSTVSLPLACDHASDGASKGSCVFTLASPASAADRRQLESFAAALGCRLACVRHHHAKQQLEVRAWLLGTSAKRCCCLPAAARCAFFCVFYSETYNLVSNWLNNRRALSTSSLKRWRKAGR